MYKGFVIKCLECGSDEVWVHNDIDYDYNEIPYVVGHHLHCINCGNSSK